MSCPSSRSCATTARILGIRSCLVDLPRRRAYTTNYTALVRIGLESGNSLLFSPGRNRIVYGRPCTGIAVRLVTLKEKSLRMRDPDKVEIYSCYY